MISKAFFALSHADTMTAFPVSPLRQLVGRGAD